MKNIIFIFFILMSGGEAFAGGSTSFESQILPILSKDNSLKEAILNTFDFNSNVWAQVRLGSHTKFGGQRLGPYTVLARPKGSRSDWVFNIRIITQIAVYDDEDNLIPLMDEHGKQSGLLDAKATRVEETFVKIELELTKDK